MRPRPPKINEPESEETTPPPCPALDTEPADRRSMHSKVSGPAVTLTDLDLQREFEEHEALEIIAAMPRDVGWFLLIGGLATELGVPGVPPFWIAGIMILWPGLGQRFSTTLRRKAPKSFNGCLRMLRRYVHDLEQRYPQHRE